MSDVEDRVRTHRKDALILLQETSRTAQLYSGFRLAGAVSHLARVQVLLAEELESLQSLARQEGDSAELEPGAAVEESTPVDGFPWKR